MLQLQGEKREKRNLILVLQQSNPDFSGFTSVCHCYKQEMNSLKGHEAGWSSCMEDFTNNAVSFEPDPELKVGLGELFEDWSE